MTNGSEKTTGMTMKYENGENHLWGANFYENEDKYFPPLKKIKLLGRYLP